MDGDKCEFLVLVFVILCLVLILYLESLSIF